MVRNGNQPRFGIVGAAAEGSIFDSVIQRSGLLESDNRAANDEVARSWLGLVTALKTALQNSSEGRLEVAHLIEIATRPPYGIRPPLAKLVAMTLIWSRRETIALYEHGSLLLQLDEAAVERLIKNPDHFYLKPLGLTSKTHLNILSELTKLVLPSRSVASMLDVVKALISRLAALPTFSLQTSLGLSTSAIALRRVIRSATEPDSLLFVEIPESLGIAQEDGRSARALAELVLSSIHELEGAYPAMLCEIDDLIRREMRIRKTSEHPSVLLRGAALAIRDNLMDPQLRSLINAIRREGLSPSEWTENIAMVVSGLGSPRNWTDEKLLSFRVLLVEQMSTFRRLLGLNIQTAGSSSDPHRFAMLTVTRYDGREEERVIHLTAEQLELASQCSEQALSQLAVTAGSAESARDLMIAALLARSEQSDRSRDLMPKIAEDTYDRGTKEGIGQ